MSKNKKIILIICAVVAAACIGYLAYYFISRAAENKREDEIESLVSVETTAPSSASAQETASSEETQQTTAAYVSPIDFEELQGINEEAFAWIEMENTEIFYPIARHEDENDRDYYLYRDLYGEYSQTGTVFTVPPSAKDMSDYVTIIYGHNQSKFSELKNFRDESYWEDHSRINIYTPEAEYTYRVFAAKVFGEEMIPYYYDLDSAEGRAELLSMLMESTEAEDRADSTYVPDPEDKIIILSTCMPNDNTRRYLVAAVLEDGAN